MSESWNYPVIVGPTAGGKTALGVELAHRLASQRQAKSEIVTADAYQIYRDLSIGTAKPTIDERRGIPHHLLDLVGLKERFTVHDWLGLADPLIAEMEADRTTPVVVGGTNLYIKAFLDGLFRVPEPSDETKAQIEAKIEAMSQPDRRAMLAKVDPEASERIDGADLRRTRRALEVYLQTGTPITELQQQWEASKPSRPKAVLVGLDWPTALINSRINKRVKIMIEQGLVDEARAIFEADGFGEQSREAIGYKQLIAHFEGRCTLDEAIERIKIDTRRFAKNQRTWLKRLRRRPGTIWIEAHEKSAEAMADEVMQRLELF